MTDLARNLNPEVTTLATCWKLIAASREVKGFTDHDQDLIIDDITYLASSGFTPAAVSGSCDLSSDSMELEGMLEHSSLDRGKIESGYYDSAELTVFLVNYEDSSNGKLILRKGWLGQIKYSKGHFVAELSGVSSKTTTTIGKLYSPNCRACLGDQQCKIGLSNYSFKGKVINVLSESIFESGINQESGYFTFGLVKFVSGKNKGLRVDITEYNDGKFTLMQSFNTSLVIGDEFIAIAGCNGSAKTCSEKFQNILNFRGEPHVPGMGHLMV